MAATQSATTPGVFNFVMLKPSHYDDDGYVIQWKRSAIPSNTLAAIYGLAADAIERRALGPHVDIRLTAIDETNSPIRPARIVQTLRRDGGRALVALVGVQSNQFPRAMDLARRFRAEGVQVAIGGFHVSGTLAMLPDITPELQEALDLGITLFAGELEGRIDEIFQAAWLGALAPTYNFMANLPGIGEAPTPFLPAQRVKRTAGAHTSFDAGRGCPFQCSFCTIINVQGRKSRHRDADDVERIIRDNVAQGVNRFFITDDNFARNRNWEPIFDRIIHMREAEGLKIKFLIQVDTLCHRTPGFVEKAGRAGVNRVFIGLESINPDNLASAKKRQNRITEYRDMMLAWKAVRAVTYAGYIIGFPNDTEESIIRDIEIIQNELPIDLLEFFYLTPLPGSEDHKALREKGAWMDPDLNKYDLNHRVAHHPRMSDAEWERAYARAWTTYYSPQHMRTVMRRARACGMSVGNILFLMLWFKGCIGLEGVHPLEGGWLRQKRRRDRRPGRPVESALAFYPRYWGSVVAKHLAIAAMYLRHNRDRRRVKADPDGRAYVDQALTPVSAGELESLELFTNTAAAQAAAAAATAATKARRRRDMAGQDKRKAAADAA